MTRAEVDRRIPEGLTRKKIPVSKVIGRTAIGVAIISGPAIGAILGWNNGQTNHNRLVASEARLQQLEYRQAENERALDGLLAAQPASCANAVRSFLPNQPNASFSDGEATLSLQQSGQCSPTDITLVGVARRLDGAVVSNAEGIQDTRATIASERQAHSTSADTMIGAVVGFTVTGVVPLLVRVSEHFLSINSR